MTESNGFKIELRYICSEISLCIYRLEILFFKKYLQLLFKMIGTFSSITRKNEKHENLIFPYFWFKKQKLRKKMEICTMDTKV